MSPATTTVADAHARRLREIWAALPDEPLAERDLEARILEAMGEYPGNFHIAGGVRSSLTLIGAVTVAVGGRDLFYTRSAKFPEVTTNNGPGSPGYNDELRRQHEARERLRREEDQRAAAAFESSPLGVERRQMVALIDQRIDTRLSELFGSPDAIARLRDLLNDDAALDAEETN